MELDDLNGSITVRDPGLAQRLKVLTNAIEAIETSLLSGLDKCDKRDEMARKKYEDSLSQSEKERDDIRRKARRDKAAALEALTKFLSETERAVQRDTRRLTAALRKSERERKSLERDIARTPLTPIEAGPHPADISRAKTIGIFGGILFAIENWSADGQTAADFTIVCQSLLFPAVYEKVMSGNEDYYIETVPVSALEVVRRGREFVQHLREESDIMLTAEEAWDNACNVVHEWIINDALPLLYGARDDSWEDEVPYSLAQMQAWRDMPQSRLLDFPKIQDGMDLVKQHGDLIRDTTGLPEFTKQTLQTRIQL